MCKTLVLFSTNSGKGCRIYEIGGGVIRLKLLTF